MNDERPIFVCASGWRSGSTLVQRLLCSHDEIHVWGENRGLCSALQGLAEGLGDLQHASTHAAREFDALGTKAWIAMLNPPVNGFVTGLAALLAAYFGDPVKRMGKSRWGFKEVRHGADTVRFLHRVFPHAKFLLLVRDPRCCLASARATTVAGQTDGLLPEIGNASTFLEHWAGIAGSFLEPLEPDVAMSVRYEDIVAAPEAFIHRVADFVDVQPRAFSQTVFKVRRRGWLEEEPRLTDEDEAALARAPIWHVAQRYGYAPPVGATLALQHRSRLSAAVHKGA
jgi:hypothetical protein